MRRYGVVAACAALLLVLVSSPASAGWQWCPRDPIIALNGQKVQIWVSIPEQYQEAITGPVDVEVTTPRGVHQEVLFTDEGFNGYGETVTFQERGQLVHDEMTVRLRVQVPYDRLMVEHGNLPVRLTVVLPDGSIIELEDDHGRAATAFQLPAHP